MPISIAQSRQQWSSLIAAAQQQPQIITNRQTPVAVLVSMDYFERSQAAAASASAPRFCDTLHQLRETFAPEDDMGLPTPEANARHTAWQRGNAFAQDAEDAP